MNFDYRQNGITVILSKGESFVFARKMLKGFRKFETRWIPPFPMGSPFFRMFYGSYFAMREVRSDQEELNISVRGPYARGNFLAVKLKKGQKFCVSGHCIAGFSGTIKSLHTRIKFQLPYWLLKRHFFPVFEGPGVVLLYGRSAFEKSKSMEFESERVVAFDASRSFMPVAPEPQKLPSKIHNILWSREVIWRFTDPGVTFAEMHSISDEDERDESFVWRWTKHILGFLKF